MKALNDLKYEALMAHDVRYDPDESQPTYIGINSENGASTDSVGWVIYKFTYSGTNATRIQKANGTWDGRAALFS